MRGYLPKVLGNSDTRTRIGRSVESGTLPHALLIAGPLGSGKHTLATAIAAALNCENKKSSSHPLPCGVCNSCRRISDGNFTDIKLLSKKKDKVTIGVGEIRDFREDMFLSATESLHKIYIIESAECLTVEAQNALLTVLEEPPVGVTLILLTTECDRLLTTVRSRVQLITTERFSDSELEALLIKKSPDAAALKAKNPEMLRGIIISSDGILGEAIRLSDPKRAEENALDRAEISDTVSAILSRSQFASLHRAFAALPTKRQELLSVLERIISAIADLIKVKTADAPHLCFYTSVEAARTASAEASLERLTEIYGAIILAHTQLTQNAGVGSVTSSLAHALHKI